MFLSDLLLRSVLDIEDFNSYGVETRYQTNDDGVVVRVPLVGVDKKDVEITYKQGQIVISATRDENTFQKVVPVKESDFDMNAIQAKLQNGLLELTIPYTKQTKPKKIEIK